MPCSRVVSVSSRFMSLSLRASVVRFSGGFIRCRVIDLGLLNSRSPSAPWIRPKPESPTPPNGSDGTVAYAITELIEVMPLRSARAVSMAFFAFLANTAEPSAYRLAFASFTASDRSFTLVTVMVGPNVSSCTAMLCSGTSASSTGST